MSLIHAVGSGVVKELLIPATRTSSANGTGIDCSEYEGSVLAMVHSAAGTGTTPTLDVKLQDSDAVGGTYADIPGAVFTQIDDTAGGSIQGIQVDASGAKAFIRAVATIAGTTPSFIVGVSVLGLPKYR